VPFEEIRINRKQRIVVEIAEMGGQCLGEITSIPICMLACEPHHRHFADKLEQVQVTNFISGFCTARSFERLPGFVDINLVAIENCQQILPEPFPTATVICNFKEPEPYQLAVFESMKEQEHLNKLNAIKATLSELADLCTKFENKESKTQILSTKSTAEEFFATLQRKESELEEMCRKDTVKGIPEDEIEAVVAKVAKSKRLLAVEIRCLARKGTQ